MKEFVRNSVTLLSANAISQGIAFVVLPVIARLYSPEQLGVLSLFLGIEGVLAVIANGKYESAILLARDKQQAADTFNLCFFINAVFSLSLFLILLTGAPAILKIFHYESLGSIIYYLPFFVFIVAFAQASVFWFNYNKQFHLTARYTLSQGVINNGLKIILGSLKAGLNGLVWANLSSHAFAVLFCFIRKSSWIGLFRFNKGRLLSVAKEHRKFPQYTLPHSFINYLAGNLPILLLSGYFGMAEIGLFSMGITLGFRPINLLSNSLDQVIFQRVAERVNKKEHIWDDVYHSIKKIFFVALPLFILVFFLVPYIVTFFLGERWEQSAFYLQIMMPWFFVAMFASSFSSIPSVFGKQRLALIIEVILIVLRLLALGIGIYLKSFVWAIALFTLVSTVLVTIQLAWFLLLIRKYEQSVETI